MSVSGPGHWMDQLFQRKLNQFEMHPEDHLWEGIARRLDEEKRRAPWFGNWWTVLIASLIVVLVTGTGAYLYYVKHHKTQQVKPEINKDLPQQLPQHKNQDKGTAVLPESNTGANAYLVSNPPVQPSVSEEWRTADGNPPVLESATVYNRSNKQESRLSSKSFVVLDHETDQITPDESSDPNQLIVSSDQSFLNPQAERSTTGETFPLLWQDRFLNHSKQELIAPAIVDGCNVYRNEKTRYFVDVYYAPELANRSLKGNDAISNSYAQERAQSEKPIMSYSTGVRGSMVFANGLSLRAGLSYSNNTERFDFVKERQTITREIKDKDGNVIRTEIEELVILDKMYNHYKYFDLPILIGYEKDLKDFILSLNSGLAFNLSADQSGKIYKPDIKTVYELERSGEANESIFRNHAGVSFIASVGLNYKYNERMMLLLEPSARYYLRSLSDASNPVSQKYLFLGMNIGLRYRIR